MLSITAEQLRDRTIAGDLGQPVVSSAVIGQDTATLPNIITVPRGQVLLITSIQLQADPGKHNLSSNYQPSPGLASYGLQLTNESGVGIWAIGFLSQLRQISDYHTGITPTAISAPPGNVVTWHPKYAIPVPGGFTVEASTTLGDFGNHAAVHGILVDDGTARTLGYNVNPALASSRHHVITSRGTAGASTIAAGRTGKCIRILDIHMRLQPIANATNTLTIQQTDGRKIFEWTNSNVVDIVEQVFSPDDIYLKSGQGLDINITTANTCSFTVAYEFVDESEVPRNVFWGCVQPTKPTPTTTAVPTGFGNARRVSTSIPVYYPRRDATAATPGTGSQHLVRGCVISAQKGAGTFANNLQTTEMTLFAVSHGAAAGVIGIAAFAQTQTNVQITPTLFAGQHDQCVHAVHDKMNVPCKPNDGGLWFDTLGLDADGLLGSGLGDVARPDADITAWSVTVWGRTIDTRFRTSTNRGN